MEAGLRPFFNSIFVLYLHLALLTNHQSFLLLLVADHMFPKELGQLVFGTLKPRNAFVFELLLDL